MSFFGESEVEDLSELHIEKVRKLEDREATRILKLYRDVRVELRDRLDTLPEGSFSAQQLRGTLYQVELAIAEMVRILGSEMESSSEDVAGLGVEHLETELKKWEKVFRGAVVPINLDAVRIASDTSSFLFNKYEASLRSYGEQLRAVFASELTNASIEGVNTSQIIRRVGQTFLGEEWKLQRLVRTELHNVYNVGKMRGMEELVETSMPDLKKTLFHPMDNRTAADSKALNRNNPIIPIDEPFKFKWQGKLRVFMSPPDRPNDRSILVPFREGWEK